MKKNLKLFLALVLTALAVLPLVSAITSVNLTSPVQYGNYSGTMSVTAQSTLNHTYGYNVSIYCNKSGGEVDVKRAGDLVATIWNATVAGFNFATTVNIASYTDGLAIYNCSAYADNSTDQAWSAAKRYITIDNTAPVCSATVANGRIPIQSTVNPTWSVTDALSLLSNNENITGPTGFTTLTYTEATKTFTQMLGLPGTYTINVLGEDTAGNKCTASREVIVYQQGGSSTIPSGALGGTKNYTVFIVLGIAGLVIYLITKKK